MRNILIILTLFFTSNLFAVDEIKINQSGGSIWGVTMLAPTLLIEQLDTFPETWLIDSVQYNRRGGEWYEDIYFNVGFLMGSIPLDSATTVNRINVAVNDSIQYEQDIKRVNNRIDRYVARRDQARDIEKPEITNAFREKKIYLRQLRRLLKRLTN